MSSIKAPLCQADDTGENGKAFNLYNTGVLTMGKDYEKLRTKENEYSVLNNMLIAYNIRVPARHN